MPKKFENIESRPETAMTNNPENCCKRHDDFGRKILMTLLGVLLVYLIFYIGTLMRNNIKEYNSIGEVDKMERTISVNGFAKVSGRNDIAVTTIGYTNLNTEIADGQAQNAKVMGPVVEELKKMGIEEKDLQSDYTIFPEYNYTQARGSEFKGYRITNNVTVKIRDLTKVAAVLSLPGKLGANQVGSLSFTIDDTENLKNEAREKAILEARRKAQRLANLLGVRLGEIISYNDYEQSPYYAVKSAYEGMGGADLQASQVMSGSRDIGMNVVVTYELIK